MKRSQFKRKTPEELAEMRARLLRIKQLHDQGMSADAIATEMNLAKGTVYRKLRSMGVVFSRGRDTTNDAEIAELYKGGRGIRSLARDFGYSQPKILRILNDAGVQTRRPGRPTGYSPGKARKTGKHAGEAKAKKLAKQRAGGDCEIRILEVCTGRALDFHHRLFRSQGGKWEVGNGLMACRACHMAVTNTNGRRDEYETNGWIVPSHKDPLDVPVLMWHGGRRDWFLLLNEEPYIQLAPFPKGDVRHPDDIEVPVVDRGLDGVA